MRLLSMAVIAVMLGFSPAPASAGFLDWLGLKKKSASKVAALSEQDIIAGLKEALKQGVQHAVTNLGHPGGFLEDAKVRIPMPQELSKVEQVLRTLRQDKLADEFVTTMNRAAEEAVPQAAGILANSVSQMTLADAKAILNGGDTAATDYFRRTSSTNLYQAFLPIVKKTTAKTGVTSTYKRMMEASRVSSFGGFGQALFGQQTVDLDDYITRKALDGLFLKIAEQEALIRKSPAARTTRLLQKVFGGGAK